MGLVLRNFATNIKFRGANFQDVENKKKKIIFYGTELLDFFAFFSNVIRLEITTTTSKISSSMSTIYNV